MPGRAADAGGRTLIGASAARARAGEIDPGRACIARFTPDDTACRGRYVRERPLPVRAVIASRRQADGASAALERRPGGPGGVEREERIILIQTADRGMAGAGPARRRADPSNADDVAVSQARPRGVSVSFPAVDEPCRGRSRDRARAGRGDPARRETCRAGRRRRQGRPSIGNQACRFPCYVNRPASRPSEADNVPGMLHTFCVRREATP